MMQDLAYIEFFAGVGNVFKCVRSHNIPAVALDMEYLKNPPGNNPMDMNSASGYACLCLLKWSHLCRGSSLFFYNRDVCVCSLNVPFGYPG